jgi:hypothetical protein
MLLYCDIDLQPSVTDGVRSGEQGTAAQVVLETDDPEYSVFGLSPFRFNDETLTFGSVAWIERRHSSASFWRHLMCISFFDEGFARSYQQAAHGRLNQHIKDARCSSA